MWGSIWMEIESLLDMEVFVATSKIIGITVNAVL